MNPLTCIPGAKLRRDEDGAVLRDKKGRPLWDKGKHMETVSHFKNAAKRRKCETGELSREEAVTEVPVYRGMSVRDFKYLWRGHKRHAIQGRWVSGLTK